MAAADKHRLAEPLAARSLGRHWQLGSFSMQISKRLFSCFGAIGAALVLLLSSGCVTLPAKVYTNAVAYEPEQSPVKIDASAAVEGVDELAPEMLAIWKHWMNRDTNIVNYLDGAGQALRNDLATSGLFARIVTGDPAKADYLVKAACLEMHPSDFRVRVTLTAANAATGATVSSHTVEHSFGTSMFDVKLKEALPGIMAGLKADLASDLQKMARAQQEQADRDEGERLANASLPDLLAGSDRSVTLARARNRAIIAAKIRRLPDILRESKTDELSALVVKIEQTILDLNHESEVAKDRAQQAVADPQASSDREGGRGRTAGTRPGTVSLDELRDLSISYRERIELLKPIAAAIKEEIANRNR